MKENGETTIVTESGPHYFETQLRSHPRRATNDRFGNLWFRKRSAKFNQAHYRIYILICLYEAFFSKSFLNERRIKVDYHVPNNLLLQTKV